MDHDKDMLLNNAMPGFVLASPPERSSGPRTPPLCSKRKFKVSIVANLAFFLLCVRTRDGRSDSSLYGATSKKGKILTVTGGLSAVGMEWGREKCLTPDSEEGIRKAE